MNAAHEKRLVKALLQRKLSRAFSKEELARLKQKGIYKEAEHEKLDAERLLVTRQVCTPYIVPYFLLRKCLVLSTNVYYLSYLVLYLVIVCF